MLQQTRAETVLAYYERFLSIFPDLDSLARAEQDPLLKQWEGLGYYRRAFNLKRAAKQILEEYGGEWPRTSEQWLRLPGVGRYTAAAIASIAFGEPSAVLDGNVKRVLARLHAFRESIDNPGAERSLWESAREFLDPDNPGDHNQALMEIGATVCTRLSPKCQVCPLASHCRSRAMGIQKTLPVRAQRKALPTRRSVAAVLRRKDGALLIVRRPETGLLAGLWEFPQVEVKKTESERKAFRRLMLERFGTAFDPSEKVAEARQTYSHFHSRVVAYTCELPEPIEQFLKKLMKKNEPKKVENSARKVPASFYRWLNDKSRRNISLHRAHQKLLEALHG